MECSVTVTNGHPMRGPVTTILCDRCATFDDDGFAIGPDGAEWCWFPRWSTDPYPCHQCGRDANERVPFDEFRNPADQPKASET